MLLSISKQFVNILAAIMAAFIHVKYVEDISYHDLSSWCNRYTNAIGIT